LKNKALASSGNYRKFLIDPQTGVRIVHTINPNNGSANQTNVFATSVIANNCMTADAYATAFMAMPLDKSISLINENKSLDGMIIYSDSNNKIQTYYSSGFKKLIFD
ncbi:FAD:protein FMN transferase, partial [Flavobacteriaceae bacterium]|nr:FAD:protein FMN transferase [Flavobacteriaceae bacterium]